jgi:hypothetical protein
MNIPEAVSSTDRQTVYRQYLQNLEDKDRLHTISLNARNLFEFNGMTPHIDPAAQLDIKETFSDESQLKANLIRDLQKDNFTDAVNANLIVNRAELEDLLRFITQTLPAIKKYLKLKYSKGINVDEFFYEINAFDENKNNIPRNPAQPPAGGGGPPPGPSGGPPPPRPPSGGPPPGPSGGPPPSGRPPKRPRGGNGDAEGKDDDDNLPPPGGIGSRFIDRNAQLRQLQEEINNFNINADQYNRTFKDEKFRKSRLTRDEKAAKTIQSSKDKRKALIDEKRSQAQSEPPQRVSKRKRDSQRDGFQKQQKLNPATPTPTPRPTPPPTPTPPPPPPPTPQRIPKRKRDSKRDGFQKQQKLNPPAPTAPTSSSTQPPPTQLRTKLENLSMSQLREIATPFGIKSNKKQTLIDGMLQVIDPADISKALQKDNTAQTATRSIPKPKAKKATKSDTKATRSSTRTRKTPKKYDPVLGKGLIRRMKGAGLYSHNLSNLQDIKPNQKYTQFGSKFINTENLFHKNILSLHHPSGGNFIKYPAKRLSLNMVNVFESMLNGNQPSYEAMENLKIDEKEYLYQLLCDCNLKNKYAVPAPQKDAQQKEFDRFDFLIGQIKAGNNSTIEINELKQLLMKFSNKKLLPTTEVNEILSELLYLGY